MWGGTEKSNPAALDFHRTGGIEEGGTNRGKGSRGKHIDPEDGVFILQFRIWLKDLSPMVWHRVQVPLTITLHEFHGVLRVAMGWEGIQFIIHTVRYG